MITMPRLQAASVYDAVANSSVSAGPCLLVLSWSRTDCIQITPEVEQKLQNKGFENHEKIGTNVKRAHFSEIVHELKTGCTHHDLFNRAVKNGEDVASADLALRKVVSIVYNRMKKRMKRIDSNAIGNTVTIQLTISSLVSSALRRSTVEFD